MAPSRAAGAKNTPGTPSPTESAFSTASADGEVENRNVGKKSLAQELEDVMERNQSHNEDAQTVAERSVEQEVLIWLYGRHAENMPSEITTADLWNLLKRVHEERYPQNGLELLEPVVTAISIVVMIVCSLLVLAVAYYTY